MHNLHSGTKTIYPTKPGGTGSIIYFTPTKKPHAKTTTLTIGYDGTTYTTLTLAPTKGTTTVVIGTPISRSSFTGPYTTNTVG